MDFTNNNLDLEGEYTELFCDSVEALDWAYSNGLSRDVQIKTSAPAMLFLGNKNIKHIESRWTMQEMQYFQATINGFTDDIYFASAATAGVSHEMALSVARTAMLFQQLLYKAACLTKNDIVERRLFLKVMGYSGVKKFGTNAPWDRLLSENAKFSTVEYLLCNDKFAPLTVRGVSLWKRLYIGGIETFVYRTLEKIMRRVPDVLFGKHLLVPSENELVIETAAAMALQGIKVTKIAPTSQDCLNCPDGIVSTIWNNIEPVVRKRVSAWVVTELIERCVSLFKEDLKKDLEEFHLNLGKWKPVIQNYRDKKTVLLGNAISNMYPLLQLCRESHIPIISAQHGVTPEISALINERVAAFDINAADCYLAYNYEAGRVAESSNISRGSYFVSGISKRHIRMGDNLHDKSKLLPMVYVSTNIYKGNLSALVAWLTDIDLANKERDLVSKVLSRLPHNVCYKPYPEENRRYSDNDPVLEYIKHVDNIDYFSEKIDMRYLLGRYRVSITSRATSTLGWQMMTGKPVVFINWQGNAPLTKEAEMMFADAMFLFNDRDVDFHEKLCDFLSQPIEDIEIQWHAKKRAREKSIKYYFSEYQSGAGKRAADMIIKKYFN